MPNSQILSFITNRWCLLVQNKTPAPLQQFNSTCSWQAQWSLNGVYGFTSTQGHDGGMHRWLQEE